LRSPDAAHALQEFFQIATKWMETDQDNLLIGTANAVARLVSFSLIICCEHYLYYSLLPQRHSAGESGPPVGWDYSYRWNSVRLSAAICALQFMQCSRCACMRWRIT